MSTPTQRLRVLPSVLRGRLTARGCPTAAAHMLWAMLAVPACHVLRRVPHEQAATRRALAFVTATGATVQRDGSTTVVDTRQLDLPDHQALPWPDGSGALAPMVALLGRTRSVRMRRRGDGGPLLSMGQLSLLRRIGVWASAEGGDLLARWDEPRPFHLRLQRPDASATIAALLAATIAPGTSVIEGAPDEPTVRGLVSTLTQLGAPVEQLGSRLVVEGGLPLQPRPGERVVPGDREDAGRWLLGAAATRGDVAIEGIASHRVSAVLDLCRSLGCAVESSSGRVRVAAPHGCGAARVVTGEWPALPRRLQACSMAVLAVAEGRGELRDTEGRLAHRPAEQLARLGARPVASRQRLAFDDTRALHGGSLAAQDAAEASGLLLAACAARTPSVVAGIEHLTRHRPHAVERLQAIGGRVTGPGHPAPTLPDSLDTEAA